MPQKLLRNTMVSTSVTAKRIMVPENILPMNVPAVKNKKVFYVSDYLYRLGPRTIQGVDELAGYLQEL